MNKIYGYCRVSSKDQNEDRQMIAMSEMRVPRENIFIDKQSGKDLMETFLSDIVLQVLSFVAENERGNIRKRQAEGIAATKVRGVKFNRPSAVLPDNFHDVYRRWSVGKLTNAEAAKECGMPVSTFSVLKEKTIWKQEEMRRHWKFGSHWNARFHCP